MWNVVLYNGDRWFSDVFATREEADQYAEWLRQQGAYYVEIQKI